MTVWRSTGGRAKRAGDVTSRVCTWPLRAESRTTRLRRTPVRERRVPGVEALVPRPRAHGVARVVRGGRTRGGSRPRRRRPPSCRGGGIRAASAVVALAERVLELVAVAPVRLGGHDRARGRSRRGRPIRRRASSTCRCFSAHLALRRGAPATAAPGQGSPSWTQVSRSRSGEGRRSSTAVASAWLRFAFPTRARTRSPGRPPDDEHDVAVAPRDATSALGEGVDLQLQLLAAMRPGGARALCGVGVRAHVIRVTTARMPLDLDTYRQGAETFLAEIDLEYYRHLAGHKAELEIEPIYDRHAGPVRPLDGRRDPRGGSAAPAGHGRGPPVALPPRASPSTGCWAARREAEAEEVGAPGGDAARSRPRPARRRTGRSPIEQANEPDPRAGGRAGAGPRRAAGGAAESTAPQPRSSDRTRSAAELGWRSYAEAYAEVRGDRPRAARVADAPRSSRRPTDVYADARGSEAGRRPGCRHLGELRALGPGQVLSLDRARRRCSRPIGWWIRSTSPSPVWASTCARSRTSTSTPSRGPTKSPRAFCSPVRVPEEVYLVIAPVGGRDDYAALFHEAGHTEHYANINGRLPVRVPPPRGQLGHGVVRVPHGAPHRGSASGSPTCSGSPTPRAAIAQARASRLVLLRRYAAKIAYELELHSAEPGPELDARRATPRRSARRPASPGPSARSSPMSTRASTSLAICGPGRSRRIGAARCASASASAGTARRRPGRWLLGLWAHGQRLDADELLAEELGVELDFAASPPRWANGPPARAPRAAAAATPPPNAYFRAASRYPQGWSCAPCRPSPACGPSAGRPWRGRRAAP